MRRLFRVTSAALMALMALALAGCLAGCLKDHPLVLPENGYDPALALRNDSLARFDTVEILLVDPDDSTRAIRIFKGTTLSLDTLGTHAAGDGQRLVYIVKGYKAGKGHCFTQEVSREGTVEFLWDTCAKQGNPPVEPKKPIPPQFVGTMLEVGPNDSTFTLDVLPFDSMVAIVSWEPFSIPEAVQWNNSQSMIPVQPGPAGAVELKVKRNHEWPGRFSANVIIGSPAGMDTVIVFVNVMDDSLGRLRGRVVNARDSAPEAGWTVRLNGEGGPQVTAADGGFDFGKRKPGRYVLDLSMNGRIGRTDTVLLAPYDPGAFKIPVAPAAVFTGIPIDAFKGATRVVVAAGHGLAPTPSFQEPGDVVVFPLDNTAPSLQRFLDQENKHASEPGEFFEAGEAVADSGGLYLAYPEDNRVGKVEYLAGAAKAFNVKLAFQPGGMLLSPDGLMVLGREASGTMVLAEIDPRSLAVRRLDTLQGHEWDGVSPLIQVPRLVLGETDYFAVDGNGTTVKARILRIDRKTRKVSAWKELSRTAASDIAYSKGRLLVSLSDGAPQSVQIYREQNLELAGSIAVDRPVYRIHLPKVKSLEGLALLATNEAAVLVADPDQGKVAASLPIFNSRRIHGMDSDRKTGLVLVTDGEQLYKAEF